MQFLVEIKREGNNVVLEIKAETPEQIEALEKISTPILASEMLGKNRTRTWRVMAPEQKLEITFY
jgi:hypothetical protein